MKEINMKKKINNYPCWFTGEAKAVADALVQYGYCPPMEEDLEELESPLYSIFDWKISVNWGFIAIWYRGFSFSIPTFAPEIHGTEAKLPTEEKVVEETKKIIKNKVNEKRKKLKLKYVQLSLKL